MIVYSGLDGHPVRLGYLEPQMVTVLNLAAAWSAREGVDVHLTSGNDHAHAENSLHYENKAVDLQVQVSPNGQRDAKSLMKSLVVHLRGNLALGFDIVHDSPGHYTHIHVEWDIRQREAPSTPRA